MNQSLAEVHAIRHGETAWNVDARIQGQLDIPLNDTGRWQAARLAAAVADEGLPAIYSSDLQRAHQWAPRCRCRCRRSRPAAPSRASARRRGRRR